MELGVSWVRLGTRISWMALQPRENGPIDWTRLADFEAEVRALNAAGITPIVTVNLAPRWATRYPTACGPLRPDAYADFAVFMGALTARYSGPETNVHHWEIGNEVDIDPNLVAVDNGYGCWGDINDPYYGGRHYGEMLKVVTPAIRAEDVNAQVWIGGLLLDKPLTTSPGLGHPELFFQGILEAGAADAFDVVAYHFHGIYPNTIRDTDTQTGTAWDPLGGGVVGKATYLRQLMTNYDVNKPLILNETALGCPDYLIGCSSPEAEFYDMQANHVVRSLVRGMAAGIKGFTWYTLEGPGWRHTGLLNRDGSPRPVFYAYQHLIAQLGEANFRAIVDYGPEIEAYAFQRNGQSVHVAWARTDITRTLTLSTDENAEETIKGYDRFGEPLLPTSADNWVQFDIRFEPIYILFPETHTAQP